MNKKINKGIRIFLLVTIMLVSGYLTFRNTNNHNSKCKIESPCSTCSKFNSCSLPEAKKYKMDKGNL